MRFFFSCAREKNLKTLIQFIVCFIRSTGANSTRVSIPPLSPQGQQNRPHNLQQPGLSIQGFEANLVSIYSQQIILFVRAFIVFSV